jgi:hypothetical protein
MPSAIRPTRARVRRAVMALGRDARPLPEAIPTVVEIAYRGGMGRWVYGLLLTVCWSLGACSQVGPGTIANARFDYNEAIVRSFDHQMLLNLVRLRYQDSILFLDLTSVVASYSREVKVGASSDVEVTAPTVTVGGVGSATWTESPTVTYSPLQGEDFAKRLLAPIQPSAILLLSRSGWGLERLLLCAVQQMNELPNGTAIGGVAPQRVLHFERFQRAAALLRDLQENGYLQLNTLAGQPDTVAITTGPLQPDAHSARELAEVLALLAITQPAAAALAPTPAPTGPASSEPTPTTPTSAGAPAAPAATAVSSPVPVEAPQFPRNQATLVLTGRSILGVLTFLAQHVEVPDEHVRTGVVRVALGPDGRPFDWRRLSGGLFQVRSSKDKPAQAFLAVAYRGYWFYIDDRDLESKSTYALLAELFSLQAATANAQAPVLTIPAR